MTVVMPVFNAMPYLDEAIASILAQTHAAFRFMIYDDHSEDGSYEAALSWADRDTRITVVRGDVRLGPSGSSQAAAAMAQTPFVMRMDGDDVAASNRLHKQLRSLIDRPDAVMIGSIHDVIDAHGRVIRKALPWRAMEASPPFGHSSILYRRAVFDAAGGYSEGSDYFEDYDLYRRLCRFGTLLVVNEPLIRVRLAGQNARLRDDRRDVLSQLSRFPTARSQGRASSPRVAATAFRTLAALSVQAGVRPALIGSMIGHVDWLHSPRSTVRVLIYVALAEISPRSVRFMSLAWAYARARLIGRRMVAGALYSWRFPDDPTSVP